MISKTIILEESYGAIGHSHYSLKAEITNSRVVGFTITQDSWSTMNPEQMRQMGNELIKFADKVEVVLKQSEALEIEDDK